ncbi:glycosyltransferase family 39 protein [Acidobacteria bacterium AH-259-D05]|nr:glycosyltransferase family 39 protein [Acidobacteria bacterium AH-259-D05]
MLTALLILCLAPFVTKAFHIDDPLFIWSAQQIQVQPLDFYGFDVNWYGAEMPMHEVTKNPPLTSYYLAATAGLLGWNEVPLHVVFILPALGVVLGTYVLAKRFCPIPSLAAGVLLFSPVFLISSTNLMSDTLMLCFWTWAVLLWVEGLARESRIRLTAAAMLIAVAALTKYFGMSLLPLLAVYAMFYKRRVGYWLWVLAIPVVVLLGYQWLTYSLYGVGLLSKAASYPAEYQSGAPEEWVLNTTVCLCFVGGCLLPALFYAPRLWSRRTLLMGVGLAAALGAAVALLGPQSLKGLYIDDQLSWGFLVQFVLFAISGMGVLMLTIFDWNQRRDADSLLLALWVIGTFVFAGFVNWAINGRSILPLVPAVAILLARRLGAQPLKRPWAWPLVPAAVVALLVTWADYSLANAGREAAVRIVASYPTDDRPLWFQGHWGFQYYMEQLGASALQFDRVDLSRGDLVVIPLNNANTSRLAEDVARFKEIKEIPVFSWSTSFNRLVGAGFYSEVWGALPFLFGRGPAEQYIIFELTRPVRSN